jgi:hypothetical protein
VLNVVTLSRLRASARSGRSSCFINGIGLWLRRQV